MRRYKITVLLIITIVVSVFSGCGSDEPQLYGPYEVVRVSDGDTIVVMIEKSKTKVRLIGVDTPESVHSDESQNTEEGKIASDYVKDLLDGTKVYLEYDVEPEDKFGRALAYVYLDDRETMLNRQLMEMGYAEIIEVPPNTKYADEFREIMDYAKEEELGFWGSGVFDNE